jgi:hypothetical protein
MESNASISRALTMEYELHPDLVEEIEKQSVYIDTGLSSLKVAQDRRTVLLELRESTQSEVFDRVERFLAAIVKGFRPLPSKSLGRNARHNPSVLESDVFAQLVERGWVLDLGPGQVGLGGLALDLLHVIDSRIVSEALERFGAQRRTYPTLIPSTALSQCGYTSSFPQHLSIVTHLAENFDAIEQFRSANAGAADISIPLQSAFSRPKVCLCPALCYHCYPTLANSQLGVDGHVETSTGRIARYESSSMVGLDRLWEFSQRSIIWLGDEDFCNKRRVLAFELALDLAKEWDMECEILTANDPFFTSVSNAKSFWQKGQDLKFELRASVEESVDGAPRTVAAASFNLHGIYFGAAFNIKDHTGGPAFSGCASWGLERMLLVVFSQHGFEPSKWPPALKSAIGLQ